MLFTNAKIVCLRFVALVKAFLWLIFALLFLLRFTVLHTLRNRPYQNGKARRADTTPINHQTTRNKIPGVRFSKLIISTYKPSLLLYHLSKLVNLTNKPSLKLYHLSNSLFRWTNFNYSFVIFLACYFDEQTFAIALSSF